MEFNNHKLIEVICALRFDLEQEEMWNMGTFSDFFKKVEQDGFVYAQERIPIKVEINYDLSTNESNSQHNRGELLVLYKNDKDNEAIFLEKGHLSIHSLKYDGWEKFLPKVEKYVNYLSELNLGKKLLNLQYVYINQFDINENENLADYLTFVPKIESLGKLKERNHIFKSEFGTEDESTILLDTVCTEIEDKKQVRLQISCIVKNVNSDWQSLAKNAHGHAKGIFLNISEDSFKKKII
jgi:uncharacterized protein (TIGR04255 family)